MWNAWNTNPKHSRLSCDRASSSRALISRPWNTTEPASTGSSPAITLSSVDLPMPESPITAT
jgi:hypothetical protein